MVVVTTGVRDKRDNRAAQGAFTITNFTEDLSLSGTEAGAANIAAVLTTLIKFLIEQGTLNGTVATA